MMSDEIHHLTFRVNGRLHWCDFITYLCVRQNAPTLRPAWYQLRTYYQADVRHPLTLKAIKNESRREMGGRHGACNLCGRERKTHASQMANSLFRNVTGELISFIWVNLTSDPSDAVSHPS